MSPEIYAKQSCQIKMVCQNLETILLVILYLLFLFGTEYLTDSYVSLGGGGHEHGSFTKKLSLPWKTELFKNVLPVSTKGYEHKVLQIHRSKDLFINSLERPRARARDD